MKKINNKLLVIGLASLIALFVLSRVFRSPKLESNLRKELVKLDTALLSEIRMASKGEQAQLVKLVRDGKRWTVTMEDKKFDADQGAVKNLLGTLMSLQAERMVSRKKDKWETFNVGEKGTNVSVYYGTEKEADFHVGNTGFNQSTQGGRNQFGGGGISAYTYIRLSDEEEVYTVDGFLESSFNRSLSDWRDKSFLRIPRDLVTRITFAYPGDSSFVVEKRDSLWYAAGKPAEETKVENYLTQLSYKNLSTFADDFKPDSKPEVTLQVEGAGSSLAIIEAWKTDQWILKSSLQPAVYFSGTGSSVDKDLFVGARKFLKE